jgi:hypothetical protein
MAPIVSFDVWDTLLRRKCHPDEIKIFSWERFQIVHGDHFLLKRPAELLRDRQAKELEIAKISLEKGLDDEYLIDDVFWSSDRSKVKDQVDFEIRLEIANTFKAEKISKHLKDLDFSDVMLISDFYMSSEQLRKIIETRYPDLNGVTLFTSADVGLNKRSGRLFSHLDIPKPWIHIGDNPISDFSRSRHHGAKPVLYKPQTEVISKRKRERRFKIRINENKLPDSNLDSNLKIAIGLVGFSAWLNSEPRGQIVFLEREGIFLKKVYDLFCRNNPWEFDCKPSNLAAVSRISTVTAAFHKDPAKVLVRIINQYPDITLERLGSTLDIPLEHFPADLVSETGLLLVTEILRNNELVHYLKTITKSNYESTIGYLNTLDLPSELVFVDLGWSGTIQDNLTDILGSNHKVAGRYFAMRPSLVAQSDKLGFLNFTTQKMDFLKIMRALRPIEMLFNSKLGRTISYGKVDSGFVPKRSTILDSFPESFESQQQEILNSIGRASEYIKENLLTISECTNIGTLGLASFVSNPPADIVEAYLESIHDETYGLGIAVHPGMARLNLKNLVQILNGHSSEIRRIYWQVGWPEALAKSTLGFIPNRNLMKFASLLVWRLKK